MRNQYPGTCYRCGRRVEVGEGHFEKVGRRQVEAGKIKPGDRRQWLLQHAECAIEHRGTDHVHGEVRRNA